MISIPFNKPFLTGNEIKYIQQSILSSSLSGNNYFTIKCTQWLEETLGTPKALLTHSCTAALEMCALLLDIRPGDEIIVPSYTFVSTVNAFVLRGAVPVFVDIEPTTLNISITSIVSSITDKTKVIVAVHYAGHSCDMNELRNICADYEIFLVEDAAQAILSKDSEGSYLGTIGDLGCLSFHEAKNIISGEGGALLINNPELIERAHVIQEKGTNRTQFLNGLVDKYTWRDLGSSFYPNDITAAFLYAQLQKASYITEQRKKLWSKYHEGLTRLNSSEFSLPTIDYSSGRNNAHIYYVMINSAISRPALISELKRQSIMAVFHYIPLHSSPAGARFGRFSCKMNVTEDVSARLLRLPFWIGLEPDLVIEALGNFRTSL